MALLAAAFLNATYEAHLLMTKSKQALRMPQWKII
jgi:hypothetical protein